MNQTNSVVKDETNSVVKDANKKPTYIHTSSAILFLLNCYIKVRRMNECTCKDLPGSKGVDR